MTVSFKRLSSDAVLPEYAHPGDAGMDLCSAQELTIPPGGRALVRTGLAMALPAGFEAQVRPRSGLALKRGVTVLNTPGTIDEGYRGEIGVILANLGDGDFAVAKGDRIAQMVIAPVTRASIVETETLGDTVRGEGGFGSTGV
jgi:dUTP pyrophosphatase